MTGLISAGADLAGTITAILYYTALACGSLLLATLAVALLILWAVTRAERKRAEVPDPGDWTDQLIADIGMCPWCQLRECGNPRMCTCEELCGMPLCRPMETETAP